MGWYNDVAPGHEGFIVGLVPEGPSDGGRFRELRYPDDEARGRTPIQLWQVACVCGWRSPQLRAPPGAYWAPFTAELGDEDLEHLAAQLWSEHWHMPDALATRAVVRAPRAAPGARSDLASGDAASGGRLDLADDAGGPRHFLNGLAVHAGEALELLGGDGRWIAGRYEYESVGDYLQPYFYFELPCGRGAPYWASQRPRSVTSAEARIELPPDAVLRWPQR